MSENEMKVLIPVTIIKNEKIFPLFQFLSVTTLCCIFLCFITSLELKVVGWEKNEKGENERNEMMEGERTEKKRRKREDPALDLKQFYMWIIIINQLQLSSSLSFRLHPSRNHLQNIPKGRKREDVGTVTMSQRKRWRRWEVEGIQVVRLIMIRMRIFSVQWEKWKWIGRKEKMENVIFVLNFYYLAHHVCSFQWMNDEVNYGGEGKKRERQVFKNHLFA